MIAHAIGRTIAEVRRREGVSVEELASGTGLGRELLDAVERGETLPSTAKLDRIAASLGLDAFALYEGRAVSRGLVVLPRSAQRADFRAEDLPILRRAHERAMALRDVSALLGGIERIGFERRAPGHSPASDGYDLARRLRRALGNQSGPLLELPRLAAESLEMLVVDAQLATRSLFAATVRSPNNSVAAIIINTAVEGGPPRGTRQAWLVERVSIAHELCHALFDETSGLGVDVLLDEEPRAGHARSPVEQRAGAFAAELLIPLHGLRERFGDGTQIDTQTRAGELVDEVRRDFSTPAEVTVNHLYNHGYVARVQGFREDLIVSARARDAKGAGLALRSETSPTEASLRLLHDRIRRAYEAGLLTDGAARTLLEMDAGEPLPWDVDVSR